MLGSFTLRRLVALTHFAHVRAFALVSSIAAIAVCLVALCALASPLALAQDPPADDDGDAGTGEAGRVIYIPYKDLKDVLDKPDGVFMPYDEFEALWRRANAKPAAPEADVAAVVYDVAYTGEALDSLASFTANLKIRTFRKGWVSVPLPFNGISLTSATLNGEPALLATDGGGYRLLIEQAPEGETDYTLAVAFEVPMTTDQAQQWQSVGFRIPQAAVSHLTFSVSRPSLQFRITPRLAVEQPGQSEDGKTTVQTFLGSGDALSIQWKTEVTREEEDAVVSAVQSTRYTLSEGVVTLESQFDLTAIQGQFATVEVDLPDTFNLRTPDRGDWKAFELVEPTAGDRHLRVTLHQPVTRYQLTITMQRVVADITAETAAALPRLTSVNQERGFIAVYLDDTLAVKVGDARGLTQANVNELPAFCRKGNQQPRAFQFLVPNDVALPFTITRKLPEITAWVNHLVQIDEAQATYRATFAITVDKAGIFQTRIALPDDYVVVECGPIGSVVKTYREIMDDPDGDGPLPARRLLEVELTQMRLGRFDLTLLLQRPISETLPAQKDNAPLQLTMPIARLLGTQQERGHVGIALKDTLNGDATDVVTLKPLGVAQLFTTGVAVAREYPLTIGYQYLSTAREVDGEKTTADQTPVSATLSLALKDAQITAEVVAHTTITDSAIFRNVYIFFTVTYAGVDSFRLRIRNAESDVRVDGQHVQQQPTPVNDPDDATAKLYTIKTSEKIRGQWVLHLHWRDATKSEKPNTQEALAFPVVSVLDVQDEFGTLLIAKKPTIHLGDPTTSNVTVVDPAEQEVQNAVAKVEALLRESPAFIGGSEPIAPTLAYRYQAHPYEVALKLVRREFSELYAVVVQRLHLEVSVTAEYTANVVALVAFQARNQQSLSLTLPTGATKIRVQQGSRDIQWQKGATPEEVRIPLEGGGGDVTLFRAIHYSVSCIPEGEAADAKFGLAGEFTLDPPTFGDAPVNEVTWNLTLPSRFRYESTDVAYDFRDGDQSHIWVDWGDIPTPRPSASLADASRVALARRVGASPVKVSFVSQTGRDVLVIILFIVTVAICVLVPMQLRKIDPFLLALAIGAVAAVLTAEQSWKPFMEPVAAGALVSLVVLTVRALLIAVAHGKTVRRRGGTPEPTLLDPIEPDEPTADTATTPSKA